RTLKDATVKRYHYQSHEQLRTHLQLFLDAYNHARRLKTLRGITPYEHVLQVWTKEPERFRLNPSHYIPGPYTYRLDAIANAVLKPYGLRFQLEDVPEGANEPFANVMVRMGESPWSLIARLCNQRGVWISS